MSATPDSLPVQSGDRIATLRIGGGDNAGDHVPAAILQALDASGEVATLKLGTNGALQIESREMPVSSMIKAGVRVVVGTAATVIAAANPARRYLMVVNYEGPEDGWMSLGGTPAVNAGVPMPLGASYELKYPYTGAVSAICPAGASAFIVVEG